MYIYYRRELIVIVKRRILNHEDYSRDKEPDAVNPSGTCVSNRHVPTLLRLPDGTHRSVLREEVFPLLSPPPRERANLEVEDEGRDSGVEIRGRGTSKWRQLFFGRKLERRKWDKFVEACRAVESWGLNPN